MPTPLYATAALALERIMERKWGVVADSDYALELLGLSAGKGTDAAAHFRAWYVGAKLLEQNLTTRAVTEADGATFTMLQPVIDSLLQLQRQYDEANGLSIPAGYEAIPAKCDPCGTSGGVNGANGIPARPARTRRVTITS